MDLQSKLLEAKIDFAPAPPTARVAQPNPVIYDLRDSPPPTDPQPGFEAQTSPAAQQYYPDTGRMYTEMSEDAAESGNPPAEPLPRPTVTHAGQPQAQTPSSQPSSAPHDEVLPESAINHLRAAAVQAGELDNASLTRALAGELDNARSARALSDEDADTQPHPHKRPRLEEEGSRGTAGE